MTNVPVSITAQNTLNGIERSPDDGSINSSIQNQTIITNTIDGGNVVVSGEIIPEARSRPVMVEAYNCRPDTDYIRCIFGNDDTLDILDTEIFFNSFVDFRGNPTGLTENWDQWKGSSLTDAETGQIVQFIKTDSNGYARFGIQVPKGTPVGDSVVEIFYEGDIFAGVGGKDTRANAIYRAYGLNLDLEPNIITTQTIELPDNNNPPEPPEPPPTPPPEPVVYNCDDRLTRAQMVELGPSIRESLENARIRVNFVPDFTVNPKEYVIKCIPRGVDPVAQSWRSYSSKRSISGIGVYFQTKAGNGAAVTLEVREMINGYPGPKIIPGTIVTLNPDQVNISSDSSVETRFNFGSPVILEANTNYCYVIKAYSTEYQLYTSVLGEDDILTGNKIDKNPVLGSMFISQNDYTWTAVQDQDLKFNIYEANFQSDGANEYINLTPLTGADAYQLIQRTSQFTLGSTELIPENTGINWYYKYDQVEEGPLSRSKGLTPEWRLFRPGFNMDLQNLTSQVLLRVEFTGGTLSPVIDRERAGIFFLRNLTTGNWISDIAEFSSITPENVKPNKFKGLFRFKAPTNTMIKVYLSINDDLENENDTLWREVVTITNSGGVVESGETTFTVDTVTDYLILDEPIGFKTGQSVTFSDVVGAPELVGEKYVRPVSNDYVQVYNSEADAINDVNPLDISAGSGNIIRSSFARYNESVLSGGVKEAQFDYDCTGVLNLQQKEGVNTAMVKIELNVDEGYEAKTPLVYPLEFIFIRS